MFEKNVRYAFLLDFYADILDEHTRNILRAYYEDDLSLAEIAEDEDISRQGVRHIIKKGEDMLDFWDCKLLLSKKFSAIKSASDTIKSAVEALTKELGTNNEAVKFLNEAVRNIDSNI